MANYPCPIYIIIYIDTNDNGGSSAYTPGKGL